MVAALPPLAVGSIMLILERHLGMGDCVFAFADKDTAAKYNTTVYAYDQMLQLYKEVMQKTGMATVGDIPVDHLLGLVALVLLTAAFLVKEQ